MKDLIQSYHQQAALNEELHEATAEWDITQMEALLQKGADPNWKAKYRSGLVAYIVAHWDPEFHSEGISLLVAYGANVNIRCDEQELPIYLSHQRQLDETTELLQRHGAVTLDQLHYQPKSAPQACRYGKRHPEIVDDPYYHHMFQTGNRAYTARNQPDLSPSEFAKKFGKDYNEIMAQVHSGKLDSTAGAGYLNFLISGRPLWCFHRYGCSQTALPDGSLLHIGGEHEDSYDEDFWIYNDVIHVDPQGKVRFYFYPESVFPSTDFHSATPVGEDYVYLIGNVGYPKGRQPQATPVYRLDLRDFTIRRIPCKGKPPGWISRHTTLYDADTNQLFVFGGEVLQDQKLVDQDKVYRLDLRALEWCWEEM